MSAKKRTVGTSRDFPVVGILFLVFVVLFFLRSYFLDRVEENSGNDSGVVSLGEIPEFSDEPFVVLNDNKPNFTEDQITSESFEVYSELDSLGRCGTVAACIGVDLMPTEPRESISQIKPTGWQTSKYDFVDGGFLYNRCHLIGFQLSGENANEKNLITGTRYMNVDGMLPFENMVADYVKETGNHVMYRVTPVFVGTELVARGVVMEGYSVEDGGEGVCFNVYVYNCQPGVVIDYATGNNSLAESDPETDDETGTNEAINYVLNKSSMRFHSQDCSQAATIKADNREEYKGQREDLVNMGYKPCGFCDP